MSPTSSSFWLSQSLAFKESAVITITISKKGKEWQHGGKCVSKNVVADGKLHGRVAITCM